jgi:hypothetical protein
MSHKKSLTLEDTISSGTTAPHLPMPCPESTLEWPGAMARWAPPTPNAPAKRGKAIEDLIKQLPPHGPPNCATHTREDETINNLISRLPTSEGLYKLFCKLIQKSKSKDLDVYQQVMIKGKSRTAVNKATRLLVIELNLVEGTSKHTMAHSVAKRKANSIVQSEVQINELRKIRNLPPPPQAQGGRPKEDLDSDSNKTTDDCVLSAGEDGSKSEDSMPKGDIEK